MTKRAPETSKKALAPSLRSAIDPFVVMDVMRQANARQAAGDDIIHMEVGQPGTPAPRLVREAVEREIGRGPLGYTDALGLPELRERIARHYREAHNLDISPARVVVTTGSSAGFVLAFLGLLDPGDGHCPATAGLSLLPANRPRFGAEADLLASARRKPVHANARGCVARLQRRRCARDPFGEPVQSDRSHAARRRSGPLWSTQRQAGSSPTKSIMASPIPARRRRRCPSRRMPSSLIASRNTIP